MYSEPVKMFNLILFVTAMHYGLPAHENSIWLVKLALEVTEKGFGEQVEISTHWIQKK